MCGKIPYYTDQYQRNRGACIIVLAAQLPPVLPVFCLGGVYHTVHLFVISQWFTSVFQPLWLIAYIHSGIITKF